MTPLKRLRRSNGFTLIELLVVILIIGILIAVAAPSFLGQTKKAQDSAAKQDLTVAYKAAKAYAIDGVDGDGNVIDTPHVQGSYSGFDSTVLATFEPGLSLTSVTYSTLSGGLVMTKVSASGTTCRISDDWNEPPPGLFFAAHCP
jgi:type IV pilus assembly protein PilA